MVAFQKYEQTVEDLGNGVHNLNSDSLKIALSNTAPDPVNDAVLADIAEISAGFGYSAGGTAVGATSFAQTGGVAKLAGNDVVFTAAGGSIGPFRYAVLYNATVAGGPLLGFWDYASSITLNDTETFTVNFTDNTNLLQVS